MGAYFGNSSVDNATVPELSYQSENRKFLSHVCCQRWINRELHGNLVIVNHRNGIIMIPTWLKVLLSSIFVFPISFWIRVQKREKIFNDNAIAAAKSPMNQENCSTISLKSFNMNRRIGASTAAYAVDEIGANDAQPETVPDVGANVPLNAETVFAPDDTATLKSEETGNRKIS